MHQLHRWVPHSILTAFGVAVYAPLLFFEKAFYGEEQAGFYYVISFYVHESLRIGTPMTWIPHYFGGVPASLDQFVSAWYPLNQLLFSFFDFFTAHHLSITIATIAGLLLSYAFGRMLGWHRASSLLLALFYFSATTYAWIQIGTLAAHSFAILPGILLALQYAYEKKHYARAILGGALALGIGFLSGFMQIIFYNYVISGLYAVFLDWTQYSNTRPVYARFPISLSYAAITILGLCIGFLQFYPSASMIDLTIRTDTYATQNSVQPYPSELLALVLPPYLSVPFFGGGGAAGMHVTVLGLLGFFFALFVYRSRLVVFFAATYALFAGFAWHVFPFSWINETIPPFSHMGGNFRWSVGAAFLIAFVATAGIEGFLRNPRRISFRVQKNILWFIGSVTVLLILGSITLSFGSVYIGQSPYIASTLIEWYSHGRTLIHPPTHYLSVFTVALDEVAHTFSFTNLRFVFGFLLWPLAGIALGIVFRYTHRTDMASYVFVGYVLFAVGGTVALQWSDLVPQSLYSETPRLVEILQSQETEPEKYRIMGYLVGEGTYLQLLKTYRPTPENNTRLQLQTLVNNANLYYGIERMDGMEPYRTLRQNRILNTVIAHDWAAWSFDDTNPNIYTSRMDRLYNRDAQKNVSIEEKLADFPTRLPLLSMMNVKYIFSPYAFDHPTLVPTAQISIPTGTSSPLTMYMYKNTQVLPRIYVAKNVVYARSERDAFIATITGDNFAETTIIECAQCTDVRPGGADIAITRYEQGDVAVEVNATTDSWLIFSESNYPGWRATIDGSPADIAIANYLFQAIRVPAGNHTVTLTYEDVAIGLFQ